MARNPRYDILFEPVKIGPVTARNRFYAVPHAAGMTNSMPHMRATFRETKAEGGWGVVCTGYVSIDPSSDDCAAALRDALGRGRRALARADDGGRAPPRRARRHRAVARRRLGHEPHQPRAADVALGHLLDGDPRQLHGQPAAAHHGCRRTSASCSAGRRKRRARRSAPASTSSTCMPAWATCPTSSCCPEWNQRTDAYGGSVANRVRIVRQLLEVTHEAVGGKCAVALRISLEELRGRPSAVARLRSARSGRPAGRACRTCGT